MITKKQYEERLKGRCTNPPEEALEILKNEDLFNEITEKELSKKITGEKRSRKAIFLSLCSIWLNDMEVPMNTLVSSLSSAGKSYTCKQIIKIFPKELVESVSKISPEAFSYWHTNEEDWSWNGKICYLNEISQSLLDSTTFKVICSDETRGIVTRNQKAVDLIVNGKPCLLVTTATTNPTSEVLNRFNIIQLDESKEQTKDITWEQALDNRKEEYNQELVTSLTYLERVNVFVPFGIHIHTYLDKYYSWEDVRMRRDFQRLIGFIKCSATLHQFQRERNDKGDVIATEQDYEIARECINYVQTNTLKGLTHKLRRAYECCLKEQEFTAKDIHNKYPFGNQKSWYGYLDDLLERGMLETETREEEGVKQDGKKWKVKYNVYRIKENSSFNLPSFEELGKLTILTNHTIDTKDTKDTIDGVKDKPIVTNVTNVMENQPPKVEIIKIKGETKW